MLEKRDCIGVVAGHLSGPWSHLCAPLPAADIQDDHIAGTDADAGSLFPCLEVGARDGRARFYPFDAFHLRHVVQNATSHNAVTPPHDAALLATCLRCDVLL